MFTGHFQIPGIFKRNSFIKFLLLETMKRTIVYKNESSNVEAKPADHWSLGLVASMNDSNSRLEEDDLMIVIKDKYPKAHYHYLILPKKNIPSINEVTKDDLELLKHMETIANKYVDLHKGNEFIVGYHALPSMHHLHLHVISTDFDSRCLKTRQHWNAFNTPYFMPSADVRKQIEENGAMKINKKEHEEHLKATLKCHKCSYYPKTVPDLKRHIIQHLPSS